jgi:DNA mismatch repair protein MSH6
MHIDIVSCMCVFIGELATMRRKTLVRFGHKRRRTTARTSVESDDDETIISQSSSVHSEVVSATKPEIEKPKRDGKQMILDLGQRLRIECRDCQMSYDRTDRKDVAMHRRFHLLHTHGIECTVGERAGCDTIGQHWIGGRAWKTFNEGLTGSARSRSAQGAATIWRMELSRLVSSSTSSTTQLVAKTMKQMGDALGAVALTTDDWRDKTLLIAELDGRVVGTALLGPIRAGVRLQRVAIGSTPATAGHTGQHVPPLALYRIYVVPALRRAGLASAMLNAALQQCVYGMDGQMLLKRFGGRSNSIAFCQPTDSGRRLAEAWAFHAQNLSPSRSLLLFDES